jgi:hypothetical protein
MMWKETEGGPRIHQETPLRELTRDSDQLPSGGGVHRHRAPQFPDLYAHAPGWSQWYASSPYFQ